MHNSFILQQYVCYTISSTCFEQHAAHPQEGKLYHHSLWYRHSSQAAVQYAGGERTAIRLPTRILYGCLQRVTIPEAVVIQTSSYEALQPL